MTDAETPARRSAYVRLSPGDPAPWWTQATLINPKFVFDTVAGRYVALLFLGSASDAAGQALLSAALSVRSTFNDDHACLFVVTMDRADVETGRLRDLMPGVRVVCDYDGVVSRAYGALPMETDGGPIALRRMMVVLDPMLRVLDVAPGAPEAIAALGADIARYAPVEAYNGLAIQAPVLFLPRVFEPELCERLVALYRTHGGEESGFMREIGGKTVGVHDYSHKSRSDHNIQDEEIKAATRARILRRLVPEIQKAYAFNVTRMERYIVACYDAASGGHFRAHRDNRTRGTAHRRFAVSINLNADFDGGDICFPEFGPRGFRPPPGGAVVFSCALLHQVSRVTCGERYAFLPFLYDDAAAEVRQANLAFVGGVEDQVRITR